MSIYPQTDGNVRGVPIKNSLSQKAVPLAFGLPMLLVLLLPICGLLASASPANFAHHLGDDLTLKAFKLSIASSLIATVLVVLFGTPLAVLMATHARNSKAPSFLAGLMNMIIFVPPAVMGLGLLLAFGQHGFLAGSGLTGTMAAVVLAQCFVACPYYIKSAAASLAEVPSVLKDAARAEEASPSQIFRYVTWPLAWRGIVAGAVLTWARALGEFGATLVFAGNIPGRTQTLPLALFSNFEVAGARASVVAILLLLCVFILVTVNYMLRRRPQGCGGAL